jgi:hypothetical protein
MKEDLSKSLVHVITAAEKSRTGCLQAGDAGMLVGWLSPSLMASEPGKLMG